MGELFMKYPMGEQVEKDGKQYRILGYEVYNDKRYLVCISGDTECRIDVDGL